MPAPSIGESRSKKTLSEAPAEVLPTESRMAQPLLRTAFLGTRTVAPQLPNSSCFGFSGECRSPVAVSGVLETGARIIPRRLSLISCQLRACPHLETSRRAPSGFRPPHLLCLFNGRIDGEVGEEYVYVTQCHR